MVEARYALAHTLYPYAHAADQDAGEPAHHKVIVIGGGPVGVAMALDLAQKGVEVLVLDDHEGVGEGSRAICFAKRALEICDRLGAGDPMVEKGVVWSKGEVFRDEHRIYDFDLLPEGGHQRPAFINLQQPYFEKYLVERLREIEAAGAPIEIRGRNRVTAIDQDADKVTLDVDTPEGPYRLTADWVVACDGSRSPVRSMMGLGFEGKVFEDNFLICDVRMKVDFPNIRRFWFDPPFNRGQSALLHKQPDDVWRIDFQLGWDIDRKAVVQPDYYMPRIRAFLGEGVEFEPVWVSVYTFQCCTMEKYRHGRIMFAGDAAHQVSPFGARGANSGIQDIDNLGWKLAAVVDGTAPESLLDTYDIERRYGADENIRNSTRTTDFMTPKSKVAKQFHNAVLDLVEHSDMARPLVNSGRLSVPCTYDGSALNGPDDPALPARTRPGSSMADAPLGDGWLLHEVGGDFVVMGLNCDAKGFEAGGVSVRPLSLKAAAGSELADRYLGDAKQAVYLIRPDQHVAARWADPARADLKSALMTAMGKSNG